MFVLPGDTTPLSAKTFLGKAGGGILQPGGSGFAVPLSALTHHTTSPGEPKTLFLLQNVGFQLWLLAHGCAGSWANIPGVELSCHLGAVNGAGLSVPLPPLWKVIGVSSKSLILEWGTVGPWDGEQELIWCFKGRGRVKMDFQSGQGGSTRVESVAGVCLRRRQLPMLCQAGSGALAAPGGRNSHVTQCCCCCLTGTRSRCSSDSSLSSSAPQKQSRREQRLRARNLCVPDWPWRLVRAVPHAGPEPQLAPGSCPIAPLGQMHLQFVPPLCCTSGVVVPLFLACESDLQTEGSKGYQERSCLSNL